jgi:GNAT superfamily N-acetyltransferase
LPSDRLALLALIDPSNGQAGPAATSGQPADSPFRPDEVACAIELLEAVLAPPEGNTYEARILVDEQDGPLSYACFGHTPMTEATVDLYWMVTAARARGRGHGRRLLQGLEQELAGRGVLTLRVETSSLEGQGGALRFYERAGYHVAGRIPDFYRRGDDLLTLCKRLGNG